MKNTILLDALLSAPDLKMTDLQVGLTNKNYLLTFAHDAYVLRVPFADSEHIVNRHHETLALDAISESGIDVETIYYDETSGYKVTRYLKDAKTYQECNDPFKIERVASLMKKFHSLHKTTGVSFAPIERYRQYASYVKNPLFDLTKYQFLIDEVAKIEQESILCHNDWVDGNMLFDHDQTYLIDYEYAADNDPLFDVVSFLSENQIYDAALRERFYNVYFEEIDEQLRLSLSIWEAFCDLLWCTWAMMMWESRKDPVYQQIAYDKYQSLQQITIIK